MRKPLKLFLALFLSISLLLCGYLGIMKVAKTLYPMKYSALVEKYAKENSLEESFVYAVIKCESGFDEKAVSHLGAKGLMQIMPETFSWLQTKTKEKLDEEALYNAETSIKYGCFLYGMLISQYKSKSTAVAAYHAGSGNVSSWLKNSEYSKDGKELDEIPFDTTKDYVLKVIKTQEIYQKLYKID